MLLANPGVAMRSCENCRRWMYDDQGRTLSGKIKISRRGEKIARPAGVPTPCSICPKESPQNAKQFELTDRNLKTVLLYFEIQGTAGACLGEMATDPIIRRNMGIVHHAVQSAERAQVAAALTAAQVASTVGRNT